jgi:hypothetical protein
MAIYQDTNSVTRTVNTIFDTIHEPGTPAPGAGIYRCEGCRHEIGIAQGHKLPPEHEKHPVGAPIRWRLIVLAVHKS